MKKLVTTALIAASLVLFEHDVDLEPRFHVRSFGAVHAPMLHRTESGSDRAHYRA
jgi:hypothetical protein